MKQPMLFGKYLLLERINVGGMAEIFLARSRGVGGFQRILAIKKILPTMAEDEEFIAMFIDEARIAAELNHTGIVQIYELGKFEDDFYIAMEFIHGKDLRYIQERLVREDREMDVHLAAAIAFKICEALDYAHNRRDPSGKPLSIIHRDISPQNVILSYDGEVKICDFGIAKAANRSQKTQAGVLKGKFGYMSPEQVRGLPLDGRSDIFTVGTLLYEMVTQQRLFIGESDFSTLEKVRNADVVPPSTYNREVPEDLEEIILRSLSKEVEDRFQNSAEMADALQLFMMENKLASSRELSSFMKDNFTSEFTAELRRLEEYQEMPEPDETDLPAEPEEEEIEDPDADPDAKTMIFASSEPSVKTTPPPIPKKKDRDGSRPQVAPKKSPSQTAKPALADEKTAIFDTADQDGMGDAQTMIFADPEADVAEDIHELPTRLPRPKTGPVAGPEVSPRTRSTAEKLFYPMALVTVLLLGFSIFAFVRLQELSSAAEMNPELELITSPAAGLQVYLDGELASRETPWRTRSLAQGEHRLRVLRPGYKTVERTFVLVAGQNQSIHLFLIPALGYRAPPEHVAQAPDGGSGPSAQVDGGTGDGSAAPDAGVMVALADGGRDASGPADGPQADAGDGPAPAAGDGPALVVEAKPAKLIVESSPSGATIILNGQKVGTTPYRADMKPDVGARIYLRKKGYRSSDKTVRLVAGEESRVKFSLARKTAPTPAKEYGYLMANTRPWSKVFVDGRFTGRETPIAPDKKLRLTTGKHKVTFEIPGGKRFDFAIEIKKDETVKLIKKLD